MALVVTRPSVTTTATLIAENTTSATVDKPTEGGADYFLVRFRVKNLTGTASIYLGPSGVTTANGFEWAVADGMLEFELEPGESLYGIVAATTQTVHAIKQGR